jgi:hypothetical protein
MLEEGANPQLRQSSITSRICVLASDIEALPGS